MEALLVVLFPFIAVLPSVAGLGLLNDAVTIVGEDANR
jgi:hypothetical protein